MFPHLVSMATSRSLFWTRKLRVFCFCNVCSCFVFRCAHVPRARGDGVLSWALQRHVLHDVRGSERERQGHGHAPET